ncbi:MAG TPA: glycoside hydrolase family 2 TIM barrel-domain containing protein [Rhodoglobus sp.]|nr:glycoside hydrolase family 2 TIM barrel-domain containing protein [Rhodoglobus sp.]
MRTLFGDDWRFQRGDDPAARPVRLPHDAMIGEPRSAAAATGNHGGYFPGNSYRYTRSWTVPDDAATHRYRLWFEGVYGETTVTVDGAPVARNSSGYRAFAADLPDLPPGSSAAIEVFVDNTKAPNGRWYTGAGIYRRLWLERLPRGARLADDGIRFVTRELGDAATVDVEILIEGSTEHAVARIELQAEGVPVASLELPVVDGRATGSLTVPSPRPWSAEHPFLYTADVALRSGERVLDERTLRTGLRTIEVDPARGLRVNGEPVLLRGACVHHDNGVLGAVSLPDAEFRRVRVLKQSGFNAVRASHNPPSPAFLDACDELGLYVLDELTDVWFRHKTPHDLADRFDEIWPEDARAMIAEDRNRPSVIMYSIGNEVAETATSEGVEAARKVNAFVHDLDRTRPTTLAVNLLLNMMAARGSSPFDGEHYTGEGDAKPAKKEKPTSSAANAVTAKLGTIMQVASRLPAADKASRDAFATVDVAGYNYAFGRYKGDRRRYPDRVMLGSESMPGDLPAIWREVERVPGVIGDFMWTGWDYLGEAGIGSWSYGDEPGGINKPYPALLAGCGAIDITGQPGAPALLAQAVWGLLDAPAITVRPLDRLGARINRTPWRSTDAVPSWSWAGLEGTAEIEVYSADDEVEVLLNGRSLGRKRPGDARLARFRVRYEPGELVAVGYRGGVETGRSALRSAQRPRLALRAESTGIEGGDGLAFVWIELADEAGVVESTAADTVTVRVEGAGELAGLGSAATATVESFVDAEHSTHRGRLLAIVRGFGEAGTVRVHAHSARHGDAELTLTTTGAAPAAPGTQEGSLQR